MKLEWNGHYWTLELALPGLECLVWADRAGLTPRGKKKTTVRLWQEDWLVGQGFLCEAEDGSLQVIYDETECLLRVQHPNIRLFLYQVELAVQEPKPGLYEIRVTQRFTGSAVALLFVKAELFKGSREAEIEPVEKGVDNSSKAC